MPGRLAGEQLIGITQQGGKWFKNEEDGINYLELKAIFLAVRGLPKILQME